MRKNARYLCCRIPTGNIHEKAGGFVDQLEVHRPEYLDGSQKCDVQVLVDE